MIRLLTDSNSQIPAEIRQRFSVDVVPMTVVVDGEPLFEGVDLDLAGITAALQRGAAVSSSTPSPGQFLQAYQRAADEGVTEILSVHTGGEVSAVANVARIAAGMASIPVEVVDTGSASFPVAMCTWVAGEVLAGGGTVADAAEAALRTATQVGNVFIVGTPALAARGGRLAEGVDPTGIPVLALADGAMRAVGRVTDVTAAVDALAAYVVDQAAGARLRIGVGQLAALVLADALEEALRGCCDIEQLIRYDVGPSVAVHTGLGTVGCVFHPV